MIYWIRLDNKIDYPLFNDQHKINDLLVLYFDKEKKSLDKYSNE